MSHGYCTECQAQVTVHNGLCLLDHRIDPATIEETSGRRLRSSARRRRGTHTPRPISRRTLPTVSLDPSPFTSSVAVIERDPQPTPPPSARPPIPAPVRAEPTPAFAERRYSPVTNSDTLSLTGLLVEELWNLGPDEDIEGWIPGELDATLIQTGVRKRRIVAVVVLVALTMAAGWRAMTWGDAMTAAAIEAVSTESARLVGHLEAIDPVLVDLADGAVDAPLEASTTLAGLDEAARRLFSVAGDLPADSDLAPVREQAVTQSSAALDVGTTVAESIAYASAIELITRPLELPASTDVDGLAIITADVTGWVTDFQSGVGSLPANELTDTHRQAMEDLASSLPEWQGSYLDALRARDTERAASHVAELATQVDFVQTSWAGAATSIADWARERIEPLTVALVVNR